MMFEATPSASPRLAALAAALLITLAMSQPVSATLIDPTTWLGCVGAAGCGIGNASLSAQPSGRAFEDKTVADQTGLGISGQTGGEIDIGEMFNVSYGVSEAINAIRIVFIFNGPEFDDVAEVARVTVNGGTSYSLSVSGTADNLATWSGLGSVVSCGPTTSAGSGCFEISNPFGDSLINSLSFTAVTGGTPMGGPGTNQSDYAIGSIRGTPIPPVSVPEPNTILLLGAGLIGLGLLRRRRAA
jgi:hypothetical protein